MRKTRVNPPNRCYHQISRVAHRAFFLDNDEKTRLVDRIRRVAAMRLNRYCGSLLWQSSLTLRCSVSEKVQQDMDGRFKQLIEGEAFATTCEQYQIDKNKIFMPMEVKIVW